MVAASDTGRASPRAFSVVWTRGAGCAELAVALSSTQPARVQGDLRKACVDARADLLVTRKLATSFDFVSVAVPHDFSPDRVAGVSAAVSSGPHSELAAMVALRLARALQVDAEMVSAYPESGARDGARRIVEALAEAVPGLPFRVVQADGAAAIIDSLPAQALLVLGAPGGSWLQRAFFGRGARLLHRAAAGAVVVQNAPPRVYHHLIEPNYVSLHLHAGEALRVMEHAVVPVLDEGRLVGVVRRSALERTAETSSVEAVMEAPIYIEAAASLAQAALVVGRLDGSPVPVVDGALRLIGSVASPDGEGPLGKEG